MFGLWAVIFVVIISLAFLVPIGFCLLYIVISFRQWSIGMEENSAVKKSGALKALVIAIVSLTLVILLWWYIINYLF